MLKYTLKDYIDLYIQSNEKTTFTWKRGVWTKFEDSEVYICLNHDIYIQKEKYNSIRIANFLRKNRFVEKKPNVKSTGFCDRLFSFIEDFADNNNKIVFIENVMNEFLPEWLERRGYNKYIGNMSFNVCSPPSYYRMNKDKD